MLILFGCTNLEEYKIERKFKVIANNKNCKIEYYYPKFLSSNSTLVVNELFEKYVDYDYYNRNCDEREKGKLIIKGDYQITLQTTDLLSIEFLTEIFVDDHKYIDTVYQSLVLNPKKRNEKKISKFLFDLRLLTPNFDRGKLYKYAKEFNEKSQNKINLRAYETNSNYAISWGLTQNDFLLYVGGEGEWFGYDKIRIPLTELK